MNILILNWKDIKNPTAGGAELVTYEHAKSWIKKGHSVTWLASSYKGSRRKDVIDGIDIRRFGNIYTVYLYAPFYYLFSGNKFDIVVDEVHGIPFFTPLYVRKPILVLIHEVANEIWDYMYSIPYNYLGKFLERIYLRLYSTKNFWTVSKNTVDELEKHGIDRKKCLIIPSPSNTTVLTKPQKKNNEPTFIWISRIVKMKGIEDVLESFKYIVEKYPKSKLKIIGGGDKKYLDYLNNNLAKNNNLVKNVDFLGFVDEKNKTKLLNKAHILLHASVKEGWGIVVIEAASQATPSVVYNVAGLNESVKDGITGIVIKQNTPREMAEQAIKLYENKKLYQEMQINCLKWARSLTWKNETVKSLKLLEKLAIK